MVLTSVGDEALRWGGGCHCHEATLQSSLSYHYRRRAVLEGRATTTFDTGQASRGFLQLPAVCPLSLIHISEPTRLALI
eukprot:42416-Alexandrium_andersonii.AAC.1